MEGSYPPKYTQSTLTTEGIRDMIDTMLDPDGVLVADDHPALAHLQAEGGFDPAKAVRWVRLDREMVRAACVTLVRNGFGLTTPPDSSGPSA